MTGSELAHGTLIAAFLPVILLGCAGVSAWSLVLGRRTAADERLRAHVSVTSFFSVLFAASAIGIIFTRQASGPHHMMALWPLPALLAVCLLATASALPTRAARATGLAVVGVLIVALVVSQVRTTASFVRAYHSNRRWSAIWSAEIYAAVRQVKRAAPTVDRVMTADWGLGTQLFALGGEAVRTRIDDQWPSFTDPNATVAGLTQQWFKGKRLIVVYHTQAGQIMSQTTVRVDAILKSVGLHVQPIYGGRQIQADIVTP